MSASPIPPPDDASLVARVRAGERDAFRPILERYEGAIFGLCARLLGGREAEAEDLSQETFIRAYTRLGELQDPRRLAPWLYAIARSLCRDARRKAAIERRVLERKLERDRRAAVGREIEDDVEGLLGTLPRGERKVLEMRYFEGLSYEEIGRRLGLSFARVDHLIRQARARLGRRVSVERLQRERHL